MVNGTIGHTNLPRKAENQEERVMMSLHRYQTGMIINV